MTRHRKIKSLAEIKAAIGARPRRRKVIMCHGTFDLVHPGHIRHLLYARERGDILVVSLTCDAHVAKGPGRPYIPQELRAQNLAVLEMVDYVLIDVDPTPLRSISELQPDIYAKGYDYTDEQIEETAAVEAYGGSVIFSPGDITYSSTAILEKGAPDLAVEKLFGLLHARGVTFNELRMAMVNFADLNVHVIGDTIVDRYVYGSSLGHNAKTPTPSILFKRETRHIGGAAIVALHLAAAGAKVRFSTVLGEDETAEFVVREMVEPVQLLGYIDPTRPTTEKLVYIADGYRMLKLDRLDNRPISQSLLNNLISSMHDEAEHDEADAVVFSDFRHGIFHPGSIGDLTAAISSASYRVADSQMASRWGNILDFRSFDLITPNEREARFALGDQDTVVRPLGHKLVRKSGCKTLMLKMGERGLMTFTGRGASEFFAVDSFARDVVDPVGAGDALLAYATLAMTATRNPVIASILGSLAAAVECCSDGNVPVTRDRVIALLDQLEGAK